MRFAYADPPYLGESKRLYGDHPDAAEYDDPEAHRRLIERLCDEYDGFGLSLHVPSLRTILPMLPEDVRLCAWVKPFTYFTRARPAYSWEPVAVRLVRKPEPEWPIAFDHVVSVPNREKGLFGAKPEAVMFWLFDIAGLLPDDTFDDLFPGTGGCTRAWQRWRVQSRISDYKEAMPEAMAL